MTAEEYILSLLKQTVIRQRGSRINFLLPNGTITMYLLIRNNRNHKQKKLLIDERIWYTFKTKYKLADTDIQLMIECLISKHLKLYVSWVGNKEMYYSMIENCSVY
jgi:hypothetical protein